MLFVSSYFHRFALLFFLFDFARIAWVIVVPQNYVEVYEQENGSGDRRFISESITNDETQREQLLWSIRCIGSFLEKHIPKEASTSLMILDDEEKIYNIAHSLVTSLHKRFAFFRHSVDSDLETHQPASNTIILMSNASSLKDDFYILKPCDRDCPFVTILITTFEDEESFLEQADILAQSMWTRRISIVAVLARVGDSVLAAGSITFQPDKPCTPSFPVIFDRCEGRSWSSRGLEDIDKPKLNGCISKIAYFAEPPYVITVNGSEQLVGFEGTLMEEMLKDQQIDREKVEWNDNTSYAEQVQMFLYNDMMADLVIGRILQQSNENIDYSTSYDMLKVVWIVPKVPNVSLKGLIQPFQPLVWAAIGASLLLGGVVKIFLSHELSWLDIFGLIIGTASVREPIRVSSKIQFISWSIFGLFLTQVYVDSLADQLINMSDLKIETMKDLISSSFAIGGTAAFASVFDKFDQTDEIILKIKEKFVIFDQNIYVKQFQELLDGRNSSFALITVLNSSRSDAIETVHAYTMTTDVICSFPLAFAAWKGYPYLRQINDKIHDFIDLGIVDFMVELAIAKDARIMLLQIAQDQEYKSELHLQQFVPAFLLMFIGFSSGFILFVLEVVLYPSKLFE